MKTNNDSYLTIENPSSGFFKDKGSRFMAYAWPVTTDTEAKQHIDFYKKEYFDARHHCYAYRLGADASSIRSNDDGEPSGTAGKPILGQLVSNSLTNVLVVVVRYFGGTLLGTGGLINAYREATSDALKNAQIVTKYVFAVYQINFGYLQMNMVMKIVKDASLDIFEQSFEIACSLKVKIRKSREESIVEKFATTEGVEASFINYG